MAAGRGGSCAAAASGISSHPPTQAMINRTVGKKHPVGVRGLGSSRLKRSGGGRGEAGERKEEATLLPAALAPAAAGGERRAGGEPAGRARSAACQLTAAAAGWVWVCFFSPSRRFPPWRPPDELKWC